MKKIILSGFLCLIMAGCGEVTSTSGRGSNGGGSSGGTGGGGSNSTTSNDTSIPNQGIYNSADSTNMKYLKVLNYARSKARECKNTDGSTSQASRGYFPAVPKLTWNDDLYHASLEHSTDMAESNTFSHRGSGTSSDATGGNGYGSTYVERIEANGYVNSRSVGENIAAGQTSIESVVHEWLESPAHCANIMSPKFKETGIAKYENYSSDKHIYWTNDFGAKQ